MGHFPERSVKSPESNSPMTMATTSTSREKSLQQSGGWSPKLQAQCKGQSCFFVLENPGDTLQRHQKTPTVRLSVVKHCTFLMHHQLLDISPSFWNYWVVLICCFVLGACRKGTCRPSLLFIYVYYPSIGKSLESHFVGGPAHGCKISEVCSVCSSKHMLSHNVCSDWIPQISVDICRYL